MRWCSGGVTNPRPRAAGAHGGETMAPPRRISMDADGCRWMRVRCWGNSRVTTGSSGPGRRNETPEARFASPAGQPSTIDRQSLPRPDLAQAWPAKPWFQAMRHLPMISIVAPLMSGDPGGEARVTPRGGSRVIYGGWLCSAMK